MRATLFRLYFQGPLKALPRAPTLLGHLFWWYRYTHGREALEELLERFRQEPPFRLSSVYPEGWLPRPKLPPVQVEETTLRKALKSLSLVRLDTFQALAERGEEALLEAPEVQGKARPPEMRRLRRTRVGVDRAVPSRALRAAALLRNSDAVGGVRADGSAPVTPRRHARITAEI